MEKTAQATFRAMPEEMDAARRAAKIECQNFSEFLRELLRSDLRQRGLWPPPHQLTQERGKVKC